MAMDIMDMESVMLRLNQKPRLMLSMALMEDMVLGTALILWDMAMDILATLPLAMVMVMAMDIMDMESVMLRLNQKPRLMLSMALMEDMVLGTALILWDMVMDILATLPLAMVMVMAMDIMDMESVMLRLNQKPR